MDRFASLHPLLSALRNVLRIILVDRRGGRPRCPCPVCRALDAEALDDVEYLGTVVEWNGRK